MPTQEERLTTVEYDIKQFKTETIKAYQDMAFEMTIIKGLTENAIGRLSTLSSTTEKHFERVDIRLGAMDTYLESIDKRLDQTNTRLGRVEDILTQILARLPGNP
jgi:hypothetical protein